MKRLTLALALVTFALTHIALTAIQYGGGVVVNNNNNNNDNNDTQIRMSPRLSGQSLTAAQTKFIRDLYSNNHHYRQLRPEVQSQLQEQLQEQQQSQQQQQTTTSSSSSSSSSSPTSQSQSEERPNLCSCSPRSFSISLDLSHNCDDNTVKKNSGIAFTICSIDVFDNIGNIIPGGDPIPTVITSVTLIEINSVGTVINVDDQYTNVDFRTSSSFDLVSISSSLDPSKSIRDQVDYVPSTAVLFMIGRSNGANNNNNNNNNEYNEEEEIIATFVWIYSNACDGVTLYDGDEYSWNVWSRVEEQLPGFCPANASDGPSAEPSSSNAPTMSAVPSDGPSVRPTRGPSAVPSFRPSSSPSGIPSGIPSCIPSGVPSGIPSGIPSGRPSSVPSEWPTGMPSSLPSLEPSVRWSGGPSSRPSSVPSIVEEPSSNAPSIIVLARNNINRGNANDVSVHSFCFLVILYLTFGLGVY